MTISGWVDKNALVQEYQQSDCFINPSLYEGMPNTVLEAMACGLPVIASNVIGNNEVVIHGKTGFLFDLSDGQALINSMLKVMHNRQCCIDFGLSARASTEKYFSWDRVVEEYLGLFKSKIPLT
ncbi:MAG: glycosyltransferase family 4 protein [Proteobacteria bacterium]|nr:glycosyltransferase family 4 protein [Pseudomonadota bacterium]